MITEYTVNAYELNQEIIYAVQGEVDSRTVIFNIVEKSGIVIPTSNAEVTNKMLDLTDYTAEMYASCSGTIEDAKNGILSFVLSTDFAEVSGTGDCVIVLSKSDTNLRIVGITLNVQTSVIESTTLSITKGTSFAVGLEIFASDGTAHIVNAGDTIRFGVKSNLTDSNYLIEKNVSGTGSNKCTISLIPAETAILNAGTYYYDIGLQTSSGGYYIVVPVSKIIVTLSVTSKE